MSTGSKSQRPITNNSTSTFDVRVKSDELERSKGD